MNSTWELSAGPLCEKLHDVVDVQTRSWLMGMYAQLVQMAQSSDSNDGVCIDSDTHMRGYKSGSRL